MVKINYSKKFDRNKYYKNISEKYFYISKNELLEITIKNHPKSTIKLEEIFNYFKTHKIGEFDTIFQNISFKCLIIGNFRTLQKIKNQINQKDNKYIKFLFDYTDLQQSKIAPFFEDNLEIFTCYYCNIDYVNTYNTKNGKKNKFTLDHYYDKSTYPYLALSLYNLIPSCYTCNSKLKGTVEFKNLAPSSKKYDFKNKVKFKLKMSDTCKNLHIKNKDDIKINLKENYSNDFKDFIEKMHLDDRYNIHKDIVFDMIQKAELYPESRLKELQDLTGIPFQQIKKDIFNLIDESEDLSKQPFSKLIVDMSKELGII
ncbi:hypothetical protein [Aliarcobacter butzleri]|uniref:hypothetical protein n=1 Tax=Aliarcobacter butzleri TaxID=28197 RepID=UPI001EDC5226|nr:hypothetical protein [Aliarcobacter butzleri]MCG3660204.1 hypothetical protein [Aliarcobacter butzleri]